MLSVEISEFLLEKITKEYLELKKELSVSEKAIESFSQVINQLKKDIEAKNNEEHEEIIKLKNQIKKLTTENKNLNDKLSLFNEMNKIKIELETENKLKTKKVKAPH